MKIITKNFALSCFIFLINSPIALGMGAPAPDNTMAPGMGAPTPAAPDNTMAPGMGAPTPDQALQIPAPQPTPQVNTTQAAAGIGAPTPAAPDNTMAPGMGSPAPDQSLPAPQPSIQVDATQAAPGIGVPTSTAPQIPGAQGAVEVGGAPANVTQTAPAVVAEVLSGPDIVQLSEDKVALVKNNNPKINKTFDDGEKLGKDRAALLKSMTDAAQALKDKVTDQETKIADFYQSFEFKEGQTEELLTPLFAALKKEEKK